MFTFVFCLRNLEILAMGFRNFGLGILTRFFRLWSKKLEFPASTVLSLLYSDIYFSLRLWSRRKQFTLCVLFCVSTPVQDLTAIRSVAVAQTFLEANERTNPRLLIALKIHTSVSSKFQTNTRDCALLGNTLRCFTPIYRRELCFPFASKISVFFSSCRLAINVLMFGWNVIDPNETVNSHCDIIRIQYTYTMSKAQKENFWNWNFVDSNLSELFCEIVFTDRYDVKFDLFVSRSIASGMHASLHEDWSNTVPPRFRGESNTAILGERRGGEGINSTRNPVCAARGCRCAHCSSIQARVTATNLDQNSLILDIRFIIRIIFFMNREQASREWINQWNISFAPWSFRTYVKS